NREERLMRQCVASAAWIASSTACRLSVGSAPGSPRQTGQTLVFGGAPKLVGLPQNIFVLVLSCTWTSKPITGSYLEISCGVARPNTPEDMLDHKRPSCH